METSTTKNSLKNNEQNEIAPKFSTLDKFFIAVTASGFLGGTVLSILYSFIPSLVPIVPAIFFGSGISSLVYRFMGGIKPDTNITIGTVTLGGTLASLVGTIWILNEVFENQMKVPTLLLNPQESSVLALQKESGQIVEVKVGVDGISRSVGTMITVPNESVVQQIKEICRTGQGFCTEPELPALFKEDISLQPGQAKVCVDQARLVGYPLLIGSANRGKMDRVKISATDNCINQPGQPMLIKINSMAAKNILEGIEKEEGIATIAPLKDLSQLR